LRASVLVLFRALLVAGGQPVVARLSGSPVLLGRLVRFVLHSACSPWPQISHAAVS
jgi:hypothetical protein